MDKPLLCNCLWPPLEDLSKALEEALENSKSAHSEIYSHDTSQIQTVATEWLKILLINKGGDNLFRRIKDWINERETEIWPKTYTSLCRLAARTRERESLSIDFANDAHKHLDSFREHAESRAESYIELARAIYPVSPDESSIYFDRAIEIASRIGEENIDRWAALLHLAKAAGEPGNPRPKTAYRLSRIAELTYEYVARDKHFDWDSTVESLTNLCPSSALAVLSRWRDRRFGYSGRLFPLVIYQLCNQGLLPAHTPISLCGIDAQWKRLQDLKRMIAESDHVNVQVASQIAYRYLQFSPPVGSEIKELKELSNNSGLDFTGLERFVARDSESVSKDVASTREAAHTTLKKEQPLDWDEIFQDVDFGCSIKIRSAYDLGHSYGSAYYCSSFFREAFKRVAVGKESQFVRAICTWPDFDIFMVRVLLDELLSKPLKQQSLKKALEYAVIKVCRKEPEMISRRGWRALLPFERLSDEGLVSDDDVVLATIEGFESQTKKLGASGFFKLIDPLAATLSPSEADEALNFGFDLLEELLKPEDGDGPWLDDLKPPISLISSLAGYIWSGLGSPVASERWEHAHAVRAAVELGWAEILDALASWADTEEAFPFVDQNLEFYLWHARQWLLIGLVRGGIENSTALRSVVSFLHRMVNLNHVLIRDLAAQGLQALATSGELDYTEVSDFTSVNQPILSEVPYSGWPELDIEEEIDCEDALTEDEKYYFGIDIGPYWLAPLGRAF
ncbi:hypothetical protein [Alteromonas macleodii]|uniref:Uncharacterized protein n=1 Tax=Alteromonas macleodii TaxID=28108 RepID=A0A6T9Y897_ALTMA|nr:hypothetical protein [Alteromonas macleodii]CAB9495803.1 conserved protein of unknown function [Alteromonas macleodii]